MNDDVYILQDFTYTNLFLGHNFVSALFTLKHEKPKKFFSSPDLYSTSCLLAPKHTRLTEYIVLYCIIYTPVVNPFH